MKQTLKSKFPAVLALGLMAGVLGACAVPPPAPEDAFYRLSPRAAAPVASTPVLTGVVEVDRFAAAGSLANRPLLFSEPGSSAVSEYHYHFWIEAPPILLQNALVSYLRSTEVAERVVTPEMRVRPDYTIRGRVMRLETVKGESAIGIAEFELSLRRESDGELLVLGEYRAEVPSGPNGVKTDVTALEKAVDKAFQDFVADIQKQ
ncbi:ABC-type transport auxiliary lipoprotein family protein [Magnetovibrio sp.]|uniref:ABC-type transport auxiliary lipoprotein family protein n=1 Tax=Magnetovibrio sp. TaxID=2024836 RepID=UPI002F941496